MVTKDQNVSSNELLKRTKMGSFFIDRL